MNINYQEILLTIITVLMPIIVNYAVKALRAYRDKQLANMENDKLQNYLFSITETVSNVVLATSQQYVDVLKKAGKFDAEAQKIALQNAKKTAYLLVSLDAQVFIAELYGDFDLWLETLIEALVRQDKKA